mmetsp:Transcript_12463/g.22218  ORF Transcript_12463/g.22218 Transcript_12463/m.22218 type:complete len:89 (-) Transcript_12463:476-742(-)
MYSYGDNLFSIQDGKTSASFSSQELSDPACCDGHTILSQQNTRKRPVFIIGFDTHGHLCSDLDGGSLVLPNKSWPCTWRLAVTLVYAD